MGFLSPEVWAKEYLLEESKKAALADFIENEMIRYKDEAVKRFCIITGPKFAEKVAATTAFGYREQLPEALNIIDELNLDEKHVAALIEDYRLMKDIIEREREEELEEWLYASINY